MSLQRSGGKRSAGTKAKLRFGPAGWMYKDWEGIVYPDPKPPRFDPLQYMAEFFETVEVNSSYYGPPSPKTTTSWVRRVKDFDDFRFTAKLWKRFTHERTKAWTRSEVDQVRAGFDVMMDGGAQRGTHVLKALSLGAKAVGLGRFYLFPLAAAGQAGVERALGLMRSEIERGMKLMGCASIGELSRDNLRFR